MSDVREQKIRERAHAIWQQEGEPHGRDADHWHRAAGEIDSEQGPSVSASKPAPKPRKAATAKTSAAAAGNEPMASATKAKRSRATKAAKPSA